MDRTGRYLDTRCIYNLAPVNVTHMSRDNERPSGKRGKYIETKAQTELGQGKNRETKKFSA